MCEESEEILGSKNREVCLKSEEFLASKNIDPKRKDFSK